MDKLKEILKWILGILSVIAGILVYKKMGNSDKIENANIKVDAKEDILVKKENEIDTKIEKKEKELETIKKDGVKDLTDDKIVEYWRDKL